MLLRSPCHHRIPSGHSGKKPKVGKSTHIANRHLEKPYQWRLGAAETKNLYTADVTSIDGSLGSTLEASVDESERVSTIDHLRQLGVEPVTAEELFDADHVKQWTPQLLAYFPLGCILAAIRFSAWVAGIAADQPWFRNKSVIDAYMALLGVTVVWKNEHCIPTDQRHVLVSNHVSVGDLLMLFQRPQRYIHLITNALPQPVYATQHLPAILQPATKGTYMQIADQLQQAQQQPQEQQHQQNATFSGAEAAMQHHIASTGSLVLHESNTSSSSSSSSSSSTSSSSSMESSTRSSSSSSSDREHASIHLFPEGGMTNGDGMMRFSRGFMLFADKLPVVPVALRLRTAFHEVESHTATSSFLSNLFWFSFQPWTVIEATALPPMQLQPGESKAAFVQRVQLAIAQELGCWITDLNIQQKRQLVQKLERRRQKR